MNSSQEKVGPFNVITHPTHPPLFNEESKFNEGVGVLVNEFFSIKFEMDLVCIYANRKPIFYIFNDRRTAKPLFQEMMKTFYGDKFSQY